MKYYFNKTLNIPFDAAVERTTAELKKESFGIMTEIDVNMRAVQHKLEKRPESDIMKDIAHLTTGRQWKLTG